MHLPDGVDAALALTLPSLRKVVEGRRTTEGDLNQQREGRSFRPQPAAQGRRLSGGDLIRRIAVNYAARDIVIIFNYLTQRRVKNQQFEQALLYHQNESDLGSVLSTIGPLSPLHRLGGKSEVSTNNTFALPISELYKKIVCKNGAPALQRSFRTLILAEQALLSSFLNLRDTIPDYASAGSAISTAEMYMVCFYLLGTLEGSERKWWRRWMSVPEKRKLFEAAVVGIMQITKRYIVKAIDTLKREREQNRNTFHLMSEAHFNLGDLLLLRLSFVSGRSSRLFAGKFSIKSALGTGDEDTDRYQQDLRRQIWEHYREGLLLVQSELEEFSGRYGFPPDVFHAYRNIMDPVLHNRICKAVRMRHSLTRLHRFAPASVGRQKVDGVPGFTSAKFEEYWQRLNQQILNMAPVSVDKHQWLEELEPMLQLVNEVRTDRGPLTVSKTSGSKSAKTHGVESAATYKISWVGPSDLLVQRRMVLFFESYRQKDNAAKSVKKKGRSGSSRRMTR